MNSDKCSLLINSFIKSYVSYCSLIWMFCNRISKNKVNKIQECYLRLMTDNYELSYEELLDLINEKYSPQRCLNSPMTEVYKCLNGISRYIRNDVLTAGVQYSTL